MFIDSRGCSLMFNICFLDFLRRHLGEDTWGGALEEGHISMFALFILFSH